MLLGYRTTACGSDELISSIAIPRIPEGVVVESYKVSRRRDLDISTVSGTFRLERDEKGKVSRIVLAFGGMAERPRRATTTEEFLTGKPWTRAVVEESMAILATEFSPLTDVRGSAGFRSTIAQNLLLKFWNATSTVSDTVRVGG
jgi:xanthine dehydrogenase iron-sulfur cluster and FAD-binding subunit A